ncbi:unnamed protein product [Gongylonema pulchrum]|uniref:Homeobox domain-containing protein n=1 Tax=Gongylonema pulchrum TaxID=637853 RepID=A0A183DEN6_9BILA|nr:unnamed protein product [Gongylonema pulchrum]
MDQVLRECKRLGLSKDITDRVRDWFIYTWQKQKTLGFSTVLKFANFATVLLTYCFDFFLFLVEIRIASVYTATAH